MEEITAPLTWNTAMLVSGIILTVTFVGIFTEAVHGFHRTKFAMGAVDWNVVFLLGGMMTIVGIMIPTGGFQFLAYKIADITKGRLFFMMALMGTLVTVLSLLLDNVTTVVIFGPLIILICRAMKITPIPYLLAAALLSDTGGVATLVGDQIRRAEAHQVHVGGELRGRHQFQYLRLPHGRPGIRSVDRDPLLPEVPV